MTDVVVVDYGAGNLRSVCRAMEAVGVEPRVTSDPAAVDRAPSLVLPGVGSAQDAMRALEHLDLVRPLRSYIESGRPFLGVCVGLQLLLDWSDEGGGVECLGAIPGRVRRFTPVPEAGLKVPHMGWNAVEWERLNPVTEGIPSGSHFYFVHSYYAEPDDPSVVLGRADYAGPFAAALARDNVVAVQFHPEKSADLGLRLYRNFARLAAPSGLAAHPGH